MFSSQLLHPTLVSSFLLLTGGCEGSLYIILFDSGLVDNGSNHYAWTWSCDPGLTDHRNLSFGYGDWPRDGFVT